MTDWIVAIVIFVVLIVLGYLAYWGIRVLSNKPQYYWNRGTAKLEKGNSNHKLKRVREAKQDCRIALKLAEQAGDENFKAEVEKRLLLLE